MEISIASEKISDTPFLLTNTFFLSLVIFLVILLLSFYFVRRLKPVPGKIQNVLEFVFESFYNFVSDVIGDKEKVKEIFPLSFTLFIVILSANLIEIIPGLGVFHLLRSPSSDLNFTLALSVFSMVLIHLYALRRLKPKNYFKKYIGKNPISVFVGALEGFSEITKALSLSIRLFGNLFAGETLLIVSSHLFSLFFPLPFLFLEILVSFIQSLIFSSLITIFYLNAGSIIDH